MQPLQYVMDGRTEMWHRDMKRMWFLCSCFSHLSLPLVDDVVGLPFLHYFWGASTVHLVFYTQVDWSRSVQRSLEAAEVRFLRRVLEV